MTRNITLGQKTNTVFKFGEISKINKHTKQAGKLGKKLEWKIWFKNIDGALSRTIVCAEKRFVPASNQQPFHYALSSLPTDLPGPMLPDCHQSR